ncbi:hypothetical protein EI94DRAFT_1755655 [Lactarius quietus]|nr:hypothetical protein EI94DRAFT_1755655 [Lactarius quietus]
MFSYPVEVGDVGFIREGRFHRLFNVLLPADDPSHRNYGVPEYHEQLTLRMEEHIIPSTLGPNNLCSARVTSDPVPRILADGPDSPAEVFFSCRRKQGAVLSLPIEAKCENTVALGDFGAWMIKHINSWFAWVRGLGVGIDRMEDIILVTGTHRTRSWTNVAFPGGQVDGQVSFGANVATHGDSVTINWKFSHEYSRGAVMNYGPNGEDLPEDQCIFIRGFRVARKLIILPRGLRAAAGPNPDPKGDSDDSEASVELMSILTVPEDISCYLLLEVSEPDKLFRHLQSLKPKVHDVLLCPDLSPESSSAVVDAGVPRVAMLSTLFEERSLSPTSFRLDGVHPFFRERATTQLPRDFSHNFFSSQSHQAVFRDRAASQPPGTFGQNFLSSHFSQDSFPSLARQGLAWPQSRPSSFNPGSFRSCSSSLSTTASAPSLCPSFGSTFEDDESEAMSDTNDERHIPSSQLRGFPDFTHSLSQSPATRAGLVGNPYGQPGLGSWNDSGFGFNPFSIPGSLEASKPFEENRHPVDVSYVNPYLRNVNDILSDDGSAFHKLRSGTGTHDTTLSGSTMKPRRGAVDLSAPGASTDDEPAHPIPLIERPGHVDFLVSDEALAYSFNSLSLDKAGPDRASSSSGLPPSQPLLLPNYRSHDPFPERCYPENVNLSVPGGRQMLMEPSDSGLSTGGSPSLGHREFQEPETHRDSLTARFIPGQGIKYIAQPDAGQSPISPPSAPQQYQDPSLVPESLPHNTLDAYNQLPRPGRSFNNVGVGVPLHAVPASYPLYIAEFKAGRTDLFYVSDLTLDIHVGDLVIVEADRGKDLGKVVNDTITVAEVEAFQRKQRQQQQQQLSPIGHSGTPTSPGEHSSLDAGGKSSAKEINPKVIYGRAGTQDVQLLAKKVQDEVKALQVCQNKVRQKKLPMIVVDAEYQWDRRKLTFYFMRANDQRIDFRELVRELFRLYKTRILMSSLPGPVRPEQ